MKVRICKTCTYYKRKTYSTYHTPAHYHAIGIPHAYSFCTLANKRCLEVKPLECDDLKLTVETNRMLKRLLNKNRPVKDCEHCSAFDHDYGQCTIPSSERIYACTIRRETINDNDQTGTADTPKPGQTDPS